MAHTHQCPIFVTFISIHLSDARCPFTTQNDTILAVINSQTKYFTFFLIQYKNVLQDFFISRLVLKDIYYRDFGHLGTNN